MVGLRLMEGWDHELLRIGEMEVVLLHGLGEEVQVELPHGQDLVQRRLHGVILDLRLLHGAVLVRRLLGIRDHEHLHGHHLLQGVVLLHGGKR